MGKRQSGTDGSDKSTRQRKVAPKGGPHGVDLEAETKRFSPGAKASPQEISQPGATPLPRLVTTAVSSILPVDPAIGGNSSLSNARMGWLVLDSAEVEVHWRGQLRRRGDYLVLTPIPYKTEILIGRSANADIYVNSGLVSEQHLHIEYQELEQCFRIHDHSTNGTLLILPGAPALTLGGPTAAGVKSHQLVDVCRISLVPMHTEAVFIFRCFRGTSA